MSGVATHPVAATVRAGELMGLLPGMLDRRPGCRGRIHVLEHRPSAYRSSFALEEIDVTLDSGELLRLVLKDLGSRGLLEAARLAKPRFLRDPLREIEFYRHVLAPRPHLRTAHVYGAVVDPSRDRYWLLLERVPGVELYQVGDVEVWRGVARWLARMHAELAPLAAGPAVAGTARAVRYDAGYLRRWITRARSFVCDGVAAVPRALRLGMDRLASRYERVVERLAAMPVTVIHGEFYASNVLVQGEGRLGRVCPVDWETVALAPGLIDLAALVAGSWTDSQRRELALTYHATLHGARQEDEVEFLEQLAYCRLHQAVQWLGWSSRWSPPAEHAHDWLGEAVGLAETLGL